MKYYSSLERHMALPNGLSFALINNHKSVVSEMQGNLFV